MSSVGRSVRMSIAAAVVLAGLGSCTVPPGPPALPGPAYAAIPLYADGIVVDDDGLPRVVVVGDREASDDPGWAAAHLQWRAQGTVPGPTEYRDLAEQALRDLDALVLEDGASLAGANPAWRYVWPRDASFAAVALARTGHPQDAHEVLTYLQRMQTLRSTGGVMEARYLPDGTGAVPDDRGLQLDGNGWVLWAVAEWWRECQEVGASSCKEGLEQLRPLVERSVAAVRAHVDPATGLPSVSPDYWEVREKVPTLGTVAPLLAGMRAAAPVLEALDEEPADDVVVLLERGLELGFAPEYPRRLGTTGRDTSVAFLMPPFAPADPEVAGAWTAAAAEMARPGGGLAPGATWKRDGISWTPTTSVFALTAAASGQTDLARQRLDWIDTHRTARGAIPEKVLWDGSPSAVAPLAWTASVVLITLDELDRLDASAHREVDGAAGP